MHEIMNAYISWPDSGISVAVHNDLWYGFAVAGFPFGSKMNLVTAVLKLEANTYCVASKVSGWKGGRK